MNLIENKIKSLLTHSYWTLCEFGLDTQPTVTLDIEEWIFSKSSLSSDPMIDPNPLTRVIPFNPVPEVNYEIHPGYDGCEKHPGSS